MLKTSHRRLAPLAAKNKADLAALDTQKAAAIGRVAQTYSAALDAAENAKRAQRQR